MWNGPGVALHQHHNTNSKSTTTLMFVSMACPIRRIIPFLLIEVGEVVYAGVQQSTTTTTAVPAVPTTTTTAVPTVSRAAAVQLSPSEHLSPSTPSSTEEKEQEEALDHYGRGGASTHNH